MKLKQRSAGDRTDGEHPLGVIEAKTRALPSGDDEKRNFAAAERCLAKLPKALTLGVSFIGMGQGRQALEIRQDVLVLAASVQALEFVQVERFKLMDEGLALGRIQAVPPGQDVVLVIFTQTVLEIGGNGLHGITVAT